MKNRKVSIFVAIVLALSLALSPVSVSAEELDTPVHEDPIDEIQTWSGNESKTGLTLVFKEGTSGNYSTLTFDASAYVTRSWTEGIYGSGSISYANISVSNVYINGVYKIAQPKTDSSGNPLPVQYGWNWAYQDFKIFGGSLVFRVKLVCDEYGDISFFVLQSS